MDFSSKLLLQNPPLLIAAGALGIGLFCYHPQISLALNFIWSCFLAPLGKGGDQKTRLDKFYRDQASSEHI